MATAAAEAPPAEAAPGLPDYVTDPNAVLRDTAQWRYGRAPDYSKTRTVYEETKQMKHVAGSLPNLVENLVKNWEVEASFKPELKDWRTINHPKYSFAINGGEPQDAEHMLKVGTYNAIISPSEYYSPEFSDFSSSHKTFKRMMPTFAWEVLEVYSGPPTVAFRWRHWGTMKNDYVGFNDKGEKVIAKAHGGSIDIQGVTVATVDESLRLESVRTWFDPLDMFRQIAPKGVVNKEPVAKKVDGTPIMDSDSEHETETVPTPTSSAAESLPSHKTADQAKADEMIEGSAEKVHPQPKDMEQAVQPGPGEAVAAKADSDEVRKTHEEMANISAAECPFMNRE